MRRRAALAGMAAATAAAVLGIALLPRDAVPSFATVRASFRPSDVELLDRHGVVLHEIREGDRQRSLAWVPLDAVSPLLRDAIVAAEDRRFATHHGVDGLAVLGALRDRLAGGRARGASTLTMQLATLLDRRAGRTHARRSVAVKLRQMRRAVALERAWTKDQILEAYLNLVPFRGEVLGVGAASGVLLGKSPDSLSQAEALVLAVLPRAPNAPPARVRTRALRLARDTGVAASPAQVAAAARVVCERDRVARPHADAAPHLATRLLLARGGDAGARRGTPLRSTLDARLQHAASWLVEEHLRELVGRNVRDAALLAVDNASGDVLAYVGGRGAAATSPYVDGVRARRQAGSTLKPFLYAAALDARLLTAASLLEDVPLALPVAGGLYQPRDYDDGFRGIVTLRSALASSLNVPAVRTLELLSPDVFVARLRALGFRLAHGGTFYGPALALGSAEVSLEELVNAYRTLANGGVLSPLRLTRDAPARDPARDVRAISPAAAFVIGDVLSDRESRSATFGLENALATRAWSAVKTGTSKEMRDNWCVGFSRRFTVGVWVGNGSGEPMHDVSGLSGAAPIWRDVMGLLEADAARDAAPAPPAGVVRASVSFPAGVAPARDEWFLGGTEPVAAAQRLAPPLPRIRTPQEGSILALDPDIPPALQRLSFAATGLGRGAAALRARWVLDGNDLGPAGAPLLWPLARGAHRLVLQAVEGGPLDSVAFEVRGAPARDGQASGQPPVHPHRTAPASAIDHPA